jgi:protein tyrosine/serine phosphatase
MFAGQARSEPVSARLHSSSVAVRHGGLVGRTSVRRVSIISAVVLAAAAGVALVSWDVRQRLPKRFAAVAEGRLYRSGTISPAQLERLARAYGIRTVVSLLDPNTAESTAEHRMAERLGIVWHNVALPGDGSSTAAERARIKALLFDTEAEPMLVHCAAGANRTGLAIGMYRLHEQGWTLEQVLEEMRQFGFKDREHHQNLREALANEALAARERRGSAAGG